MEVRKESNGLKNSMVTREELAIINQFTKRALKEDEVYTFAVRLCDNEVDRDGERFPRATLEELAELFVGKSGIFDHEWTAKGQAARIYRTEIVEEEGVCSQGEGRCYLKGYAYMLRGGENDALIAQIEGGIKKEVSVGCSVERCVCSICGGDIGTCAHRKGEKYGGKVCCAELTNAQDAYEWSFVAVPAQPAAGVTKSHAARKALHLTPERAIAEMERGELHLDAAAAYGLRKHIAALEEKSEEAGRYRQSLCETIRRRTMLAQPQMPPALLEKSMAPLTVTELEELAALMKQQAEKRFAPMVQTAPAPENETDNRAFCI